MLLRRLFTIGVLLVVFSGQANGQNGPRTNSKSITFEILEYRLETSCTIESLTGTGEEIFQPIVPWSDSQNYSCTNWQCTGVMLKLTDVSSLIVSITAASFSPDPGGKLVHNPVLRSNDGSLRGQRLNYTLDAWYEDITRTNFPVWTESTITVYAGLPITTYTGTARIEVSCSD